MTDSKQHEARRLVSMACKVYRRFHRVYSLASTAALLSYFWWTLVLIVSCVFAVNAQSQCPSSTLGSRWSLNGYCECSLNDGNYYLQCFRLSLNGLKTIISSVDAEKISSLVIRRSTLPNLPANLFKRLKSLKKLSIVNSGVRTIPCNLFESKEDKKKPFSDALEIIDFSFNQIESLCSRLFFPPLNGLAEDGKLKIDLHYSQLTSIPKDLFGDGTTENTKVAELDLSWNPQLVDLPDGIFSSMPQLTSLDLSHNLMREFRHELFTSSGDGGEGGKAAASKLKSLDLDNNRLRSLRSVDFKDFAELEELDLSGNYIASLPTEALPKTLVKLDLGNNLLHTLPPKVFDGLSELQELDLSSNPFEHLPSALFSTNDNLKQLALRNYPQGFLNPQIFGSNLDLDTIDFSGANLRLGVQRSLLGEAHAQRGSLAINVDTNID